MTRPAVVGNKWVLTGAVMYLLEWAAIIPAGDSGPADPGASKTEVLKLYQGHPKAVLFLATWCSLVLLGRVLIITGLREALRSVGHHTPLIDLAVGAMVTSVAVELLGLISVATGQALAVQGGHDDAVLMLDTFAGVAWGCVFAPLGLAVGLSSFSMLRSRAFPTWIPALGCLSAVLLVVGGLMSGPGYLAEGSARSISGAAMSGVPLFWLWMLAAGVFLVRRTPKKADVVPAS